MDPSPPIPISDAERALRTAVEEDPRSAALAVLLDLWAETGHHAWVEATRAFLFDRPKRVRLLFARMPGSQPSELAEEALRRRLDASEALFFGQPLEAVTARFDVAWSAGACRFDQDMRLRLDGSYGVDWLQPSRCVERLVCGSDVPLALPPDRELLAELSRVTTGWVADGCPGHADPPASWFDDLGGPGRRVGG